MPVDDSVLEEQLATIGAVIAKRARTEHRLDRYYEGDCPLPEAVTKAKVTKAYRMLVGLSDAPWGAVAVDSVLNRLQVTGISSGDKTVDNALWEVWQTNGMDAESQLANNAALVSGRSFALVWPDENDYPEISLDNASQMAVMYAPGSRRRRQAAMRYWVEQNRPYATLYRADGIYKYIGPEDSRKGVANIDWQKRTGEDEDWPLENPYEVVPVVELPVNRRLKPGQFGYARGEFESCTGLIDRINLLTFLGLVVAFYMGFPLRGVIGEKIRREVLKTDDGQPIIDETTGEALTRQVPLFDAQASGMFQLENPQAALAEFKAADRSNLSIYAELDQFAALTHTPRHYLPLAQGMTNLSADAIRASEGTLIAKIPSHQASLGEGYEEILRLSGLMLDEPVDLPQTAELTWGDHETRSLAERADAAVKLKDILPQSAIIEYVLNATSEQMNRWQAERSGDVLNTLLSAATRTMPAPPTLPVPVLNGGGGR